MLSSQGRVVGLIGVDLDTGKALWYRFDIDAERFPQVSREQAAVRVREHLRAQRVGEDQDENQDGDRDQDLSPARLVIGRDRKLYWRIEGAGGEAWLLDAEETISSVIRAAENSAVEAADDSAGAPACCRPLDPRLKQREGQALDQLDLNGPSAPAAPLAIPAAYNLSGIPYHYQITSWYCCLAGIQMIFDYYGQEIGQHDIGDVADEDGSTGVYHTGIVRAVLLGQTYERSGWKDRVAEQYRELLLYWGEGDPGIVSVEDATDARPLGAPH